MSANGNGLVTAREPRSLAAEAYRTLRTNIQFSSIDREVRSLLVTSAGPNEGKSTVVANLGVTMAEGGKRVVVVDADLRRPGLHRIFNLDEAAGLTTMVLDQSLEPPLQGTHVPGLRLLASGPLPPNPAELLASERLVRTLARLLELADLVILDSPPIGPVSDAAILASRVDGTLLVVDSGHTRLETARQAKEQLERVGARLLGVVLNNVKPDRAAAQYHRSGR